MKNAHPTKKGPGRKHGHHVEHGRFLANRSRNGRTPQTFGAYGRGLRNAITAKNLAAIKAARGA